MADKEYYVKDFKKWAYDRFYDFQQQQQKSESKRFIHTRVNDKTILIDTKKDKMVVAKCRPDEQFNSMVGLGVAYARLMGQPIPKERRYVKLETLKIGQNFTTKSGGNYALIGVSKKHSSMFVCEIMENSMLRYFAKDQLVTPIK